MFNIHSTSASTGHKTYGPRNVAKLATAVITLREATGEKKNGGHPAVEGNMGMLW